MNNVKSANAKMKAKVKNVAQRSKSYQKSRPMKQNTMPQECQKTKISKLIKHKEHEEDLELPEVPTETFETVRADLVNVDMKANLLNEDIERKLTKLKFSNPSWLKDVSKTWSRRTDVIHKVSSDVHKALAVNDDEVPAADLMIEENAAEYLYVIEVVPEPIVST